MDDVLVEQIVHADTVLELTGEYESDCGTQEERIARKLNAYFQASSVDRVERYAKRKSVQLAMDEAELGEVKAAVASTEDSGDDFQEECLSVEESTTTATEPPSWQANLNLRTYRNIVKRFTTPSITDDDEHDAPGAYAVTPRNRSPRADYGNDNNDGIDDDDASCAAYPDAPPSLFELEQAALSKIYSKRRRCASITITVMLIFLAILGLLLFRYALVPSTDADQEPSIVEHAKQESCNLEDIYIDCQLKGTSSFRSKVPDCAFSEYVSLIAGFVPHELSDVAIDGDIISCAPENLALLTLAANREASRNKFILNTLYFAANGHKWRNNAHWLSVEPECSWFNVTCQSNGSITEIVLTTNDLEGTLPSVLGLLDQLEVLKLSNNFLESTIPETFSGLSKLQDLSLNFNYFDNGPIPPSLFALTSLQMLSLSSTQRTGIPSDQLIEMTNLRTLELELNLLTYETIPTELFLLTTLEVLNLKGTNLRGSLPSEISHLTALKRLELSGCYLTGTFPSEIGLLTSLSSLVFSDNDFVGVIPEEVCSLWSKAPLESFGEANIQQFRCEVQNGKVYGGLTCPSEECCPDKSK